MIKVYNIFEFFFYPILQGKVVIFNKRDFFSIIRIFIENLK